MDVTKIKKMLRTLASLFIILSLVACGGTPQQERNEDNDKKGKIISSMLYSPKMDVDWNYSVYLPPSYEDSNDEYPVVYFLHGAYGTHKDYHSMFDLKARYEELIEQQKSKEMILVFIDGFNSYYVDTESIPMESAIMEDLMPFIENEYRITPEDQFVTGLSMGGYGAARFALKYPDKFKGSFLMSPGIWFEPSEDSSVRSRFHVYKDSNSNFSMDNWKNEHPISVMDESIDELNMKIMSGVEDPIISEESLQEFVEYLEKKGLEVDIEMIKEAGHNWDFWSIATEEALVYFSELVK